MKASKASRELRRVLIPSLLCLHWRATLAGVRFSETIFVFLSSVATTQQPSITTRPQYQVFGKFFAPLVETYDHGNYLRLRIPYYAAVTVVT